MGKRDSINLGDLDPVTNKFICYLSYLLKMRQRIITVPKDKNAEEALDYDEAEKEQLIELSIEEADFQFLYENGFIELINKVGDTNIDSFEDDAVRGKEHLSEIVAAINRKEFSGIDSQYKLIQDIVSLFKEAIDRDTGVYFYF